MIHWYRAALRHAPKGGRRISVPALLLWGEGDRFLGTRLIEPAAALCDSIEVVRFPDNTHWLPHEQPEAVVHHMVESLTGPAGKSSPKTCRISQAHTHGTDIRSVRPSQTVIAGHAGAITLKINGRSPTSGP